MPLPSIFFLSSLLFFQRQDVTCCAVASRKREAEGSKSSSLSASSFSYAFLFLLNSVWRCLDKSTAMSRLRGERTAFREQQAARACSRAQMCFLPIAVTAFAVTWRRSDSSGYCREPPSRQHSASGTNKEQSLLLRLSPASLPLFFSSFSILFSLEGADASPLCWNKSPGGSCEPCTRNEIQFMFNQTPLQLLSYSAKTVFITPLPHCPAVGLGLPALTGRLNPPLTQGVSAFDLFPQCWEDCS